MDPDKRDAERVPILGTLQGEIMLFQPMLIREISHDGVTIETRTPLQLDSLHDVRLTLGGRSVVVKGRVVHARITDVDQDVVTYRMGMEFVDAPEATLSIIGDFVDALKTHRSGS